MEKIQPVKYGTRACQAEGGQKFASHSKHMNFILIIGKEYTLSFGVFFKVKVRVLICFALSADTVIVVTANPCMAMFASCIEAIML